MPENQNFEGDRWTQNSIRFLRRLGWTQVGDSNFDISCTVHTDRRGQGHGIDSLFRYYDPYLMQEVYVIVESKYRQWAGLNTAKLKDFITQVVQTIECAPSAPELIDIRANNVYTGLILCWANDEFDYNTYMDRLTSVGFRNKNFKCNIFVASNFDIQRWLSVVHKIEQLRLQQKTVTYLYPSIEINHRSNAAEANHITLTHLFSKFIFTRIITPITTRTDGTPLNLPQSGYAIFSFDEVCLESLEMLLDLCKQNQMQTNSDFTTIYLYENEGNVRTIVSEFERSAHGFSNLDFQYLIRYDGLEYFPNL